MTQATKDYIVDVEFHLDDAMRVYGIRSYSLSYKGVEQDVLKLRKLGYVVIKTTDIDNHYTVHGKGE